MELIINGGKTVICPECYAHNKLEKPVTAGQIVLCYACRLRLQIRKAGGKLEPVIMSDPLKKEDKSW